MPREVRREQRIHVVLKAKETLDDEGTGVVGREDKGKAIVLYNAFDTLTELDSSTDASKGPISSPNSHPDD
ncbi:UNVERIFIED_CONTAM: hypothetical protein Sradi_1891000 [Sesamum radiatum]|uniref:Uncharacterized protein n=1 Tax=Sesamum radiatum TaxID=300843 RepID=A0AAW2TX41_SESRA